MLSKEEDAVPSKLCPKQIAPAKRSYPNLTYLDLLIDTAVPSIQYFQEIYTSNSYSSSASLLHGP